ncbi:hypothetical protein NSERUTF1_6030 [Nocardia seriolae]|nr:hypothetical protein NSERUTF1_6030 [Nocardia seriolae]
MTPKSAEWSDYRLLPGDTRSQRQMSPCCWSVAFCHARRAVECRTG